MKKQLALCIIIMLMLSACGENNKNNSNITVADNLSEKNISDISSDLNDTASLNYFTNSAVGVSNSSETTANEQNSGNSSESEIYDDPIWAGQEYGYFADTDTTFNTFIEWAKNYGKTRHVSYELEWNKDFLEWASNSNELLLPIVLNDEYKFHNMSVNPYSNTYRAVYAGSKNTPLKERTLAVVIRPQTGESTNLSVEEYLTELIGSKFKNNADDYKKITKDFKWGKYQVKEYWCIPSEGTAFVKLGDYQISIVVYGGYKKFAKWDEKFFDYIDFESVSLKD